MKIKLTQVQCASMRRRVYHPLKHLLKLDTEEGEEARRLDAIWEKLLGWGTYSGKTIDLTRLNDLELILLEHEMNEFVDRARGELVDLDEPSTQAHARALDVSMSAVDRLARLTK